MREPTRSTITIRDVAAHAGVSRMTVSRVVNGASGVTPETRCRIEAAIAETGYRPDPAARALASRRGAERAEPRIGLVYPANRADALGALLAASLDSANRLGMRLVPVAVVPGRATPALADVEGMLFLAGVEVANPQMFPAVAIGPETPCAVTAIHIDEAGSARLATERLVSLGHRRIGFLGSQANGGLERAREAGFQRVLVGRGLVERSQVPGMAGARLAALALLARDEPVTAIVAADEALAVAALSVACELGLAVPQDLTLCSFAEANSVWPGEMLRAVLPVAEICRAALRLLREQIDANRAGRTGPGIREILVPRRLAPEGAYAPPRISGRYPESRPSRPEVPPRRRAG